MCPLSFYLVLYLQVVRSWYSPYKIYWHDLSLFLPLILFPSPSLWNPCVHLTILLEPLSKVIINSLAPSSPLYLTILGLTLSFTFPFEMFISLSLCDTASLSIMTHRAQARPLAFLCAFSLKLTFQSPHHSLPILNTLYLYSSFLTSPLVSHFQLLSVHLFKFDKTETKVPSSL